MSATIFLICIAIILLIGQLFQIGLLTHICQLLEEQKGKQ